MRLEVITTKICQADATRQHFRCGPLRQFSIVANVARIVKVVKITFQMRKKTHGPEMIDLIISFAARPEFMQQAKSAASPEIGADVLTEGAIRASHFGGENCAGKICQYDALLFLRFDGLDSL